jgi:hypothetical protein
MLLEFHGDLSSEHEGFNQEKLGAIWQTNGLSSNNMW